MDQHAADLQARMATVTGFGDLVNAMRGVAAARAQRARSLVAGVQAYAATVAGAMAQALALLPPGASLPPDPLHRSGASLWLVFGAEQGFNGGFSEQVLAAVPEADTGRVLMLGSQLLRLAHSRGVQPEWQAPLIAHADAVVAASESLRAALVAALVRQPAATVEMVFAEVSRTGDVAMVRRRLLPLDLTGLTPAAGMPPLVNLPPARLLDDLTLEHVTAQLAQALLHSHAAENLFRLRAMAAAHDNVLHMVEALEGEERSLRQTAITDEIVELAAGLRALHSR
jgi:F-type H+-transporting ATPase subunit gamma